MANGQSQCKECGCKCSKCNDHDHDMHLHAEIEHLKQKLVERDTHIVTMETNVLNEANKFPHGELAAVQEELLTWQDKYRRLYDAHRRIQRVNQGLEDKLLRLVDVCETEKSTLTKDVATLSHKLAEANYTIKKLTEEKERYKNDVTLAIQFLQCKQGNFVSQKLDSLPNEVQAKVSSYVGVKRKPEEKKAPPEVKSIKVPIPTFPPTAMVYSIPKAVPDSFENEEPESPTADIVSAAIMAKVLEERERERASAKHCDTCTCSKNPKIIHDVVAHEIGTQTGDGKSSLCLKCNGDLSRLNSVKVVKEEKSKSVPIYTHDYDNNFLQVSKGANVVKGEADNYLKESSVSSDESRDSDAPFLDPNRTHSEPHKFNVNHHHLCDKSSSFQCDQSAKKCNARGPRYCSVRVQSGSKNILLDNIHTNVPPVLYTHPHDKKGKKDGFKIHSDDKEVVSQAQSLSSGDYKMKIHSSDGYVCKKTRSYSSDDKKSINLVGESIQNQQKVAQWIENNQNNMENGEVSSDNSTSDRLKKNKNDIDPIRYAEMEDNVKRFLFGESQSEFLRKVAIGKQNYQNLRDYTDSMEKNQSRSSSHTETQI